MIDKMRLKKIIEDQGLEVPTDPEDFDRPFADLGLDSLDVFGVLSEIESITGRAVSDEDFEKLRTFNDIISFATNTQD